MSGGRGEVWRRRPFQNGKYWRENPVPQSRRHRIPQSTLPVLLDSRGTEPSESVPLDRGLPMKKFLNRQSVSAAGLLKGQQAASHRQNHFSFTPNNPSFCIRQRQIGNGQRMAVGADHILGTYSNWIDHRDSYSCTPRVSIRASFH